MYLIVTIWLGGNLLEVMYESELLNSFIISTETFLSPFVAISHLELSLLSTHLPIAIYSSSQVIRLHVYL